MPRSLVRAFLIGALCIPAFGAGPGPQVEPRVSVTPRSGIGVARSAATLRLDVKLILVPVSVTDATDKPVTNLTRDRFHLLEDGVEQTIASFSREEGPVSVGILFDSSGSMRDRLETSISAMREFFTTILPGDEFFLIQFSDEAHVLTGFTPLPDEIFTKLGLVQAKGWTALLDAVALGTHQMRKAKNSRRVLLILSDGGDNNSRFTEAETRNMVLESDVRVCAISLFHRPRILRQLAEETGGKSLVVPNLGELPDAVQKLSAEIRSEYILGYASNKPPNDGKYHKVKVDLIPPAANPPLRISWRHGYYAPGE